MTKLTPRAPAHVIKALRDAYLAATMEHFGSGSPEHTEMLREGTRLYRETWVLHPLARALAWAEGAKLNHDGFPPDDWQAPRHKSPAGG